MQDYMCIYTYAYMYIYIYTFLGLGFRVNIGINLFPGSLLATGKYQGDLEDTMHLQVTQMKDRAFQVPPSFCRHLRLVRPNILAQECGRQPIPRNSNYE